MSRMYHVCAARIACARSRALVSIDIDKVEERRDCRVNCGRIAERSRRVLERPPVPFCFFLSSNLQLP
jgi:hypothetical protein